MSSLNDALYSPIGESDLIGFYKVLCHRGYSIQNLKAMIENSALSNYAPHQAYLNFLELPEVSDALNLNLIREYSLPIPIRLKFGAVVFGFAWDNFITDYVRRHGVWEPEIQTVIESTVRPGDVVIDIGANIGCHSALLSTLVGSSGVVHAFEPVRHNIEALRRMKAANDYAQLQIHPVAVSSKEGVVQMNVHLTNSGGNSIVTQRPIGTDIAQSVRLDEYLLPSVSRVDFIKIDVEGHEGSVLQGASALIEQHRPKILMEMAPGNLRAKGTDPVELLGKFADLNMSIKVIGSEDKEMSPAEIVSFIESRASFMDVIVRP